MQQINLLLTSLPDGILLGFVYGIAAMGLTLIWGVMNVINLAHGPIIALGMFGTFDPDRGRRVAAWHLDLLYSSTQGDQCTTSFVAACNIFSEHDHYWSCHCGVDNIAL